MAPRPVLRLAGAALAVLASGCLATEDRKVSVRRDQELLDAKRAAQKLTHDQLKEQWAQAREDRRPSPELVRRGRRLDQTEEAVAAVLRAVPEDPWDRYERERRDVLYRRWADHKSPLAPLEPDRSGPPGWIGPKVPELEVDEDLQAALRQPEAEAEPAPAEEEGGDDPWGGDEADDAWGDGGDDDDGGWGDDDW